MPEKSWLEQGLNLQPFNLQSSELPLVHGWPLYIQPYSLNSLYLLIPYYKALTLAIPMRT